VHPNPFSSKLRTSPPLLTPSDDFWRLLGTSSGLCSPANCAITRQRPDQRRRARRQDRADAAAPRDKDRGPKAHASASRSRSPTGAVPRPVGRGGRHPPSRCQNRSACSVLGWAPAGAHPGASEAGCHIPLPGRGWKRISIGHDTIIGKFLRRIRLPSLLHGSRQGGIRAHRLPAIDSGRGRD
jgi:hypothetical protein